MKRKGLNIIMVFICGFFISYSAHCQSAKLKVIIIRHGEKTAQGDNLTCQGINRSLQLPAVIVAKFGVPDYLYVPSLGLGENTSQSRMFQTVTPLAVKYDLAINSEYKKEDGTAVANDIMQKKGTVLLVWEHHAIASIVNALGVDDQDLKWSGSDFDSIWVITFDDKGRATLTRDMEGLTPSSNCPY